VIRLRESHHGAARSHAFRYIGKMRTVRGVAVRSSKIGCGERGGRSVAGISAEWIALMKRYSTVCLAVSFSCLSLSCNTGREGI